MARRVSGNVYLVKRRRGQRWYARWRDSTGRQHQKLLGPVWTGSGRPAEGSYTKKLAQDALVEILAEARNGAPARLEQPREVTFAEATREWLRHAEHERGVKSSTLKEYRTSADKNLVSVFGDLPLDQITTEMIDRWLANTLAEAKLSRRTVAKLRTMLNGIFRRACKVYGLAVNPVAAADSVREGYSGEFEYYSPEEARALACAAAEDQDAAMYLAAAFTGLRMGELIALRWRDIDHEGSAIRVRASYSAGFLTTPKSGKVRSVPMVPEVAEQLARLKRRERFAGDDDLVFPATDGDFQDRSALRRRFITARKRAKLRQLRFHDLRHTFGSLAINRATIVQVQHWMGHSDVKTTMRYLHHQTRAGEAALLAGAFVSRQTDSASTAAPSSTRVSNIHAG